MHRQAFFPRAIPGENLRTMTVKVSAIKTMRSETISRNSPLRSFPLLHQMAPNALRYLPSRPTHMQPQMHIVIQIAQHEMAILGIAQVGHCLFFAG
jgi:hypothetical protein